MEALTVEYAAKSWLKNTCNPERLTRDTSSISWFQDMYEKEDVSRLNVEHMLDYITAREKAGVVSSTIRRELTSVSSMITYCIDTLKISMDNPAIVTKRSQKKTKRIANLPPREVRICDEDLEKILSCSRTAWLSWVCRLALQTTMRRSEIIRIEPKHINFEKNTLFVPRSKNGKSRHIPLRPEAVTLLSNIPKLPKSAQIITDSFIRARKKAVKTYGNYLLEKRFHDLRHEAITRLFELGHNVAEVQRYSGHACITTLQIYINMDSANIAKRARILEHRVQNTRDCLTGADTIEECTNKIHALTQRIQELSMAA